MLLHVNATAIATLKQSIITSSDFFYLTENNDNMPSNIALNAIFPHLHLQSLATHIGSNQMTQIRPLNCINQGLNYITMMKVYK